MNQSVTTPTFGDDAPASRQGFMAIIGLVLAVLLLAVAVALWVSYSPAEGSAEVSFARDMIAHHEQAVEMALIMRDRAADETIRILADDIILTQQNQSGRMSGWLEIWGRPPGTEEPPMGGRRDTMGMAPQVAVNDLRTLPVAEAEVRFLQLMITHHEGGVLMADAALRHNVRPEVRRLAEAIVAAQQTEINQMRHMLDERGAESPEPIGGHDHE
jgi:uncharacterized protein (DUF305 family)